MALIRWSLGAVLVSFLLLVSLLPQQFPPDSKAQQTSASQATAAEKKAKRVYTNDDWPFNRPSPEASAPAEKPTEAALPSPGKPGEKIAPFVPTPMLVVEKMLEIANVSAADVVYDLGSGDGRVVILAAQKYGARAVGVELDSRLAEDSAQKVQELELGDRVTIIRGDLLQADLKPATVVAVYLLPDANEKLRPRLEKNLNPGVRVVAHDIRIPGWRWDRTEPVQVGSGTHYIYLYRIPEAFQH